MKQIEHSVIVLSFQIVRLLQTVQIPIRVFTICHSIYVFCTHFPIKKILCSNFRIITVSFSAIRNFKIFTVFSQSLNPYLRHTHKLFREKKLLSVGLFHSTDKYLPHKHSFSQLTSFGNLNKNAYRNMFQKCAFHYHENAHNATHENYRIGQLLQMLKWKSSGGDA